MPRDINRIPKVLEEISKIWSQYPDLRLCQLIHGATGSDNFYLEDDVLLKKLSEFNKKTTLVSD